MKKVNRKAVRDVSGIIQSLRDFLLGRKHNLHGRFPPYISPRSIPTPDVPRGPEYKYSDQYYYKRHYMDSSHPPVVAPVAEGPPVGHPKNKKVVPGGMKPDQLCFRCLPTPGTPWWWDGHCYYEFMEESPPQTSKFPPNVSKV